MSEQGTHDVSGVPCVSDGACVQDGFNGVRPLLCSVPSTLTEQRERGFRSVSVVGA